MPRVLIAGCGYLGLAAARLFELEGWEVIGLSRSAPLENAAFRSVTADIADAASLAALALPPLDAVIHCASSGRGGVEEYRRVYLEGARHLLRLGRLIFTSSTSVYAQNDGSLVTEDSPAEPDRETSRVLREAEHATLAAGGCVARLAGIYGPARSVLLRKFFSGEAVLEDGGARYVNQIHRDDAAAAIVRLTTAAATGIYNVCDDTPLTQREIYEWLAQHFAKPLPPHGAANPNRKRGVTNKRVSNAKLRALGWQPRYPSFRDAVATEGMALCAG